MQHAVLDAIASRRSIRAYQTEQITGEQLQAVLDAGLAAPSARNGQPWHFTAVQSKALIERINEAFREQALAQAKTAQERELFSNPAYSVFYHAPTVVFVSCPTTADFPYARTDGGIAVENMALAAHALGLGSVILGMPRLAFEGPQAAALSEALSFPEGYGFLLALSLGIPATTKEAHPITPGHITIIG